MSDDQTREQTADQVLDRIISETSAASSALGETIEKPIDCAAVPLREIPSLRYGLAQSAGVKRVMMTTWGGLGDQVVAEPTLRYAFKLFKGHEISLLTSFPDLFDHLPFKKIYAKNEVAVLNPDDWLVLHTNAEHGSVTRDFLSHNFTQAVDFCSLSAFQRQLPVMDRRIMLQAGTDIRLPRHRIVVHPGRHWPSKTFPREWWSLVLHWLAKDCPVEVLLVGRDVDAETGTVDVEVPANCIDLRNKLSLKGLITVLKHAAVVVTNDSAPLHVAACGEAFIHFVASCKRQDYLFHHRGPEGRLGWRMEALNHDGIWNHVDECPSRSQSLEIDALPPGVMDDLLPDPGVVAYKALRAYNDWWEASNGAE